MKKNILRVGIVGTGGMGGAHARTFSAEPGVAVVACCDVDRRRAHTFARYYGIPAVYRDYLRMFREEELDAVVNATPDRLHAPVAIAAARAGLHLFSEKPLATSVAEGKRMVQAVRQAGVVSMVNFSYRNCAALQEAARRIARGHIGEVRHVESSYLQSWLLSPYWGDWRTSPGLFWRLTSAHGHGGTLGDIGCHLYDATALLAGPIAEISCRLGTFDKGVRGNRWRGLVLDTNDSFCATVRFENGALGTVHAARCATGHLNSLRFRVYGSEGAVEVDLDKSATEYRVCMGKRSVSRLTWKTVSARPVLPNPQRFIRAVRSSKAAGPCFCNGLRVQAYLQCSQQAHEKGRAVAVPRVGC